MRLATLSRPYKTLHAVHFLPPTTTSHLQPLDAGIINSFKAQYRRQQLKYIVHAIDGGTSPILQLDSVIRFVKRAWDTVTMETIANCWRHVGIVHDADTDRQSPAAPSDNEDDEEDNIPLAELVRRAAAALAIEEANMMTADEFRSIDSDAPTFNRQCPRAECR
eukprot:GHVO01031308.1.p1 GENE.GHVO01031308.1~~GHVO01031308.1.p1  ORF type:complete len:164 (-),score=8.89 GHVO01031308.1:583-1074(-)